MNRQLTALSGVAIVLVVLHHTIDLELTWLKETGVILHHDWAYYMLVVLHRLGKVAVPLFLLVSGSFIAYAARGNPPKLSWQSIQSALRRLIWPYLIWSLAFYLLVYFQRNEHHDLLGYFKSLATGYPFHFVPLLVFFYAISVPLSAIARRFGVLLVVALAVLQLLLLGVEYPGTLMIDLPSWTGMLSIPILGKSLALWGVYFPLGMVYSLNSKQFQPWLLRLRWLLLAFTLIFFVLDVLHTAELIKFPLAVHLYPFSFVLLVPLIKRNWIPRVEKFEYLGKRSYGLYLTHMIVIDLMLWLIQDLMPGLFNYPIAIVLPIFVIAIAFPLLVMGLFSTPPIRIAHRYVFG